MSERRFFGGNNLAQALLKAAGHYSLAPEEVAYRVIEKRSGFVKSPKKVLIEVDPAAPRRAPGAVAPPAPVAPVPAPRARRADAAVALPRHEREELRSSPVERAAPEVLPEAAGVDAEAARQALALLTDLGRLSLSPTVRQGADELVVELTGEDAERLTQRNGELLRDLEHLTARVLRGQGAAGPMVRFDSGGFREDRAERLRRLALDSAAAVRSDGRPRTLAPLPPAARRLVHLALAEATDVETASEGDGHFKRVTVRLRPERST